MRQTVDRKNLIRNSFLLCFLIFFAFFCASARAEEEWKLPAEYALTQEEEGRFENWSADQKAELLSLLMQSGQLPASADAQSAVERKDASALTAIITEWLGLPEDAVTAHSILQRSGAAFSFGPFRIKPGTPSAWPCITPWAPTRKSSFPAMNRTDKRRPNEAQKRGQRLC